MSKEDGPMGMRKRRITLHDGRYLIFYTFENSGVASASSEKETEEARRRKPEAAVPQAEEERSV